MPHQHQQPINITEKLTQIEQTIKEYSQAQAVITDRIKSQREQYAQVAAEIQSMGANPQTMEEDLKALAQAILQSLQELEALLPQGLLEEMKQELNRPAQAAVELPNFGILF